MPPEQRFEEIFKAARVLLREGVTEETQIIPTLALANEVGQGPLGLITAKKRLVAAWEDSSEVWEAEVGRFILEYPTFRPVRVVDGILILEWFPVSIDIHNYPGEGIRVPREVMITVHPHPRKVSPEQVAALYEKTLSDAGIPCEETRKGSMNVQFSNKGYLLIGIERSDASMTLKRAGIVRPGRKPRFPHPIVAGEYYRMLLGTPSGSGFARYLTTRQRGPAPKADNLIPACVAAYLRYYGEIKSRKEIHRLLNEYVLSETRRFLPEEGYASSETNKLSDDVKKVKNRLLGAAYALYS